MATKGDRLPDEHDYVPEEPKKKDKKKEGNFFQRTGGRINQWFRDMKAELKKVVWPSRTQIINNSAVVFVLVLISAIVIWGFDEVALFCVDAIISLRGR